MIRTSRLAALTVATLVALAWPLASTARGGFDVFHDAAKDATLRAEIAALARGALTATVRDGRLFLPPSSRHAALRRHVGVFVTLVKDGTVRGCMGALEPVERDAAADIVRATTLAATEDRRYPPVRASELDRIVPLVSIVGPRRAVASLSQLDPLRQGLFVEWSGRGGVLLPGEALASGVALQAACAKAGIPPRVRPSMYVFPTVVFAPGDDGRVSAQPQRRQP